MYTSGTTSQPKLVSLTHANLCTAAYYARCAMALSPRDRSLNILPLFHISGLVSITLASLLAGASVAYTTGFAVPEFFTWLDELQPTWYHAVPTMHQAIVAHASDHQAILTRYPLRFVRSSAAPLSHEVRAGLERVFQAPVVESYGLTETPLITCNALPLKSDKRGSVRIAAGIEVAILGDTDTRLAVGEIGEIVARGASVLRGYHDDAVASVDTFTPQGWFRTGDQGYLDADGFLFITGRLKELINRGGEKIAVVRRNKIYMFFSMKRPGL